MRQTLSEKRKEEKANRDFNNLKNTKERQARELRELQRVYWDTFKHFKCHIRFVRDTQSQEDIDYVYNNLMGCDDSMKIIRAELKKSKVNEPMHHYDYNNFYDPAKTQLHLALKAIEKMNLPEWIEEEN